MGYNITSMCITVNTVYGKQCNISIYGVIYILSYDKTSLHSASMSQRPGKRTGGLSNAQATQPRR